MPELHELSMYKMEVLNGTQLGEITSDLERRVRGRSDAQAVFRAAENILSLLPLSYETGKHWDVGEIWTHLSAGRDELLHSRPVTFYKAQTHADLVERYLSLPVRVPGIEWTMMDMLMAAEIIGYKACAAERAGRSPPERDEILFSAYQSFGSDCRPDVMCLTAAVSQLSRLGYVWPMPTLALLCDIALRDSMPWSLEDVQLTLKEVVTRNQRALAEQAEKERRQNPRTAPIIVLASA